ncbi:membrane protein insertion efficiency factor YidD [Aminiphilus circumscriptus]|nr:membrane protein insertion efficiency factor YidD [Aminiphilus circumscriptus]
MAFFPILFYQRCLSPFLGTNCRFYPTCSQYMLEAILGSAFLRGNRARA